MRPIVAIFITLYSIPVLAIDPTEPFIDDEKRYLYESITSEVRCLVCQNQTIADSTAPLASDLRREIRRMVDQGQVEVEIKDFLVERYGDFILYKPRFRSWTLFLWLIPIIFLIIGILAFIRILNQRSHLPIDIDAA